MYSNEIAIQTDWQPKELWTPELDWQRDPINPIDPIMPPPPPPPVEETPIVLDEQIKTMGIIIYGNIIDKSTGNLLPGCTTQTINLRTGEKYNEPHINESGSYQIWNDTVPIEEVGFVVSYPGYKTRTISMAQLQINTDIVMSKKAAVDPVLIAAVIALIAFAKKRKKEVGKVTTADVFPFMLIGGGVLAFVLIKQILEALGIWKDKDEKELDDTATDPGSWWSPTFWRNKPSNVNWSYSISGQTAMDWSAEIYDAFGPFNDCEECAITVFKRCRTQANASYLADVFQQRYGQDLLTFLRGGWWPQDRLSDADVNVINNYVNRLPKW